MNKILNIEEKKTIAKAIKDISLNDVDAEFAELVKIGKNAHTIGPRSRIGNNIVDYFTFVQRLETKGKYDASFLIFCKILMNLKRKSLFKIC